MQDNNTNPDQVPQPDNIPDQPEQPVSPPSPAFPSEPVTTIPTPKKSKKGLVILLSVVAVLLIAAGVVAYLFLKSASDDTKKTTDNTTQTQQTTAAANLTKLETDLKAAINSTTEVTSSVGKASAAGDNSLVSRINGNYWVNVDTGADALDFTATQATAANNEADFNAITSYFKTNGYDEITTPVTMSVATYDSTQVMVRFFASKDIVCNFYTQPNGSHYLMNIFCATTSGFTTNGATIKPFAEAYLKSSDAHTDTVFDSNTHIKDSATAGYRTAWMGMGTVGSVTGGFAGNFYQTPDKTWHWFTGTQNTIDCNLYNTADIKAAYAGETCFDSTTKTDSTVTK